MNDVTIDEAVDFLMSACRNWIAVSFDADGAEDVRVQLERFLIARTVVPKSEGEA